MTVSKYHFDKYFFRSPVKCGIFELYQLGEMLCNENSSVEEHRQVCDEITFVSSGKGVLTENGKDFLLEKGSCFFSFCDETHKIKSDPTTPLHFYFIGFKTDDISVNEALSPLKLHSFIFKDGEIYVKQMIKEIWAGSTYFNEMICTYLSQFIFSAHRTAFPNKNAENGNVPIIYRLITYMENHLCEIDALSKIENSFNYSYGTLSREFSRIMGKTLRACFNEKRMDYACELLKTGFSVTETAEKLGYSSVHPFSRAYKNHFGFSPERSKKEKCTSEKFSKVH